MKNLEKCTSWKKFEKKRANLGYSALLSSVLLGCSVDTHQKQETTSTQPIKKEVQLPAYESPLDGLDINKLPGKSLEELQNLLYAIFIETKRSNNTQAGEADRKIVIDIIAKKNFEENQTTEKPTHTSSNNSSHTKPTVHKQEQKIVSTPKSEPQTKIVSVEHNKGFVAYKSPLDNIENLEEGGIDAYEELLKEISAAENSATHCKANKEKAKKDYIKILDLAEPKLQEHYEVKLWNELDIYNDNKIALIIQKARDLGKNDRHYILNKAIINISSNTNKYPDTPTQEMMKYIQQIR